LGNEENTYWLFHFDGNDSKTTTPAILSPNGSISTAQSKFGGSSFLFTGTTDSGIRIIDNGQYTFGTNDFTVEMFVYLNEQGAYNQYLYDARASTLNRVVPTLYTNSGIIYYFVDGANRIFTGNVLSINTWYHIAISRSGTTIRLFLDGTQVGSWTNSASYIEGMKTVSIGNTLAVGNQGVRGYLDEIRISNTARYTANFTPTTTEFTEDANTLLLLHGVSSEVNDPNHHRQCFDDAF
jgi:hypothetical protein